MLGIVENDVQYRAYKGLGEWEGMPQYDLRSIISIAPEIMQLIVSENSKIKTLMDLQNKNIFTIIKQMILKIVLFCKSFYWNA